MRSNEASPASHENLHLLLRCGRVCHLKMKICERRENYINTEEIDIGDLLGYRQV
mgnify:CR=1 FL=1